MANKLYPKTKTQFLQAGIDLSAVNVRAILIDAGAYTYDDAHDFLDDIPSGARIAVSGNLTNKTFGDDGSFDSDDPTFTACLGRFDRGHRALRPHRHRQHLTADHVPGHGRHRPAADARWQRRADHRRCRGWFVL